MSLAVVKLQMVNRNRSGFNGKVQRTVWDWRLTFFVGRNFGGCYNNQGMSRKKRKRFAQLKFLPNVIDRTHLSRDSTWLTCLFDREAPLILEIGCGRGEYTLALARRHPDRNILGIDRNGARLWSGATTAVEEGLSNAGFARMRMELLVGSIRSNSVSEIWLPFPDPLPRRRQAKHRLVSPGKLRLYRRLLRPKGSVHLKTDDEGLMRYCTENVREMGAQIDEAIWHIHADDQENGSKEAESLMSSSILTTFEKRHLSEGKAIKYLKFRFSPEVNGEVNRHKP